MHDSNAINAGTPNAFVKAIQTSAAGTGPTQIDANYAEVAGNTLCETCGFIGDVSQEFTGSCKSLDARQASFMSFMILTPLYFFLFLLLFSCWCLHAQQQEV